MVNLAINNLNFKQSSLWSGKKLCVYFSVTIYGPVAPWRDGLQGLSPSRAAKDEEEWVWKKKEDISSSKVGENGIASKS